MAAGATYEPLATTTLTSTASTITFSSISGSYTDLIIVSKWMPTSGGNYNVLMRYNSDSGSNYSTTDVWGDSGGAQAARVLSATGIGLISGNSLVPREPFCIIQIMNYSNSTTYKTGLIRDGWADLWTRANVNLWKSTSAITTISFHTTNTNFEVGTNVTIYGIKAA